MSIILANFGKYAISDCLFICLFVCLFVRNFHKISRTTQSIITKLGHKQALSKAMIPASSLAKNVGQITRSRGQKVGQNFLKFHDLQFFSSVQFIANMTWHNTTSE